MRTAFLARRLATLVSGALAALVLTAPAHADNVATPGDFTGYGFDQCLAPSQGSMNMWLNRSPFFAVGIYISGDSRGCRNQPNLTPAWVSTQLAKGWRLLPITLGPQASCSTHFPRYSDDKVIFSARGTTGGYPRARSQGQAEAVKSVNAASALGISAGSTLWYDLEAFDSTNTGCRESALRFLSGWVWKTKSLGYRAGVYSSASSGIAVLDRARINRPGSFVLPDAIWIARWDGVADTRTTYIGDEGWNPHARVKQYQGGHNETYGGVTINIDRNWVDLGRGSVAPKEKSHCGGVHVNYWVYNAVKPGIKWPAKVKALQCLLKERRAYAGPVNGVYDDATVAAANAWQQRVGRPVSSTWSVHDWTTLLSAGAEPVLKIGSASPGVRRLQRALNAELSSPNLTVSGRFNANTLAAVRIWQKQVGRPVTGVVAWDSWARLQG